MENSTDRGKRKPVSEGEILLNVINVREYEL